MIVSQPDRVLLRRQVDTLGKELTGVLLDVGGGDGRRYDDSTPNVTSRIRLDHDAKHNPDIVGSAEAIPLEDASVDSVLCTQVLEHVPHPWLAIREMYRVLRPGGKVLITIPQLNELHEEPHDYFRYTCFGLRTMCEETGFRVLTLEQRGKFFSSVAQLKVRRWIDTWKPYDHAFAMAILGPWTALYTNLAIWRDSRDTNPARAKHAIGWAILLEKPRS